MKKHTLRLGWVVAAITLIFVMNGCAGMLGMLDFSSGIGDGIAASISRGMGR